MSTTHGFYDKVKQTVTIDITIEQEVQEELRQAMVSVVKIP